MRDTKTKGGVSCSDPCSFSYILSICSWKLIIYDTHVLLLQVFGFGVHLWRWMLMAPKYLSFILTQKDLRVLGNPMFMTIGLCSDVSCVVFFGLLF
jgi:hypothetical protein